MQTLLINFESRGHRPGLAHSRDYNTKWVLQGGEVDGFSSLVAFKGEQEIGIIVLTNFGNNTAQNMAVPPMEIVWDWVKKS